MKRALPLLLLLALAAGARPAGAQAVRDSVRMTLHTFRYAHYDAGDNFFNCGGGIYATWPNVASQVLGREGRYSDYSRVATEGMYIPGGWGEETTTPEHNTVVPPGRLGHRPHYSWGWGPGPIPASCANSGSATLLGGGWTVLNAAPYRITEWYAVFNVPNGRPIALFEWEPADGLSVAFDGSFESGFSHEVDNTAPRNKRAVATYAWDFGDGQTGAGATPTHAYAEEGDYTVRLTVTDDDGQQSAYSLTVTVNAAHLTVEITSATDAVEEGDTMEVVARVTNSGTEPVEDVEAHRLFSFSTSLGDELNLYNSRRTSPTLTALPLPPGEPATVTRATLAPGESFEVRREYRVDAPATWRPPGASAYRPVESVVEADLYDVDGQTDDGEAVEVRRPCLEGDCDDETTVLPAGPDLTVEVELTNADGPVTVAPAGRQRRRGALGQWITDHVLTRADGSHCISGCVDVTITVTDADGEPVEGADVRIAAPVVGGAGIATPEQGGGFFCTLDVVDTCGRILELDPTDAEGVTYARYWFPGLIGPATTTFTVIAHKPDYDQVTESAPLAMAPTRVEVGASSVFMSQNRTATLFAMESARRFLNSPNLLMNACKKMVAAFWGPASGASAVPMDSEFIKGTGYAADFACGNHLGALEEKIGVEPGAIGSWLALFDAATKLAAFTEQYWFHRHFGVPGVGLAVLSVASPGPPFLDVQSDFEDAVNAAMARFYSAGHFGPAGAGGTMELEIFETSYRRMATGGVSGEEPALYLRIRSDAQGGLPTSEHTALVRVGYRPGLWLTEEGVSVATVAGDATAGATTVPVAPPSPLAPGLGSTAEPYAPGDVITLAAGLPAEETVQVAAVAPGEITLTAPLRYDHPAGTTAARVDSLALGPPPAPLADDLAVGFPGAPLSPTLAWTTRAPALAYDVEVATDSLFSALVFSQTVAADSVAVGPLAESVRHYWRVRAANLAGTGPWSTRFSFVPGRPAADALAGAVELPGLVLDGDPVVRGRWTTAATTEAGETAASCAPTGGSLWFRVTPSVAGTLQVDTFGSLFDTVLSAWTGDAHPLAEVACNDDGGGGTGVQSVLRFPVEAGQTYLLQVAGYEGAEGLAVVSAALTAAPPNDDLAYALPLGPMPVSWSGDTYGATAEEGEAPGCTGSEAALWWRYVPATSDVLTVYGWGVPAELTLWTPGPDGGHPLVQVACAYGDEDTDAELSATVTAGQTYYLRLAAAQGGRGALNLYADGPPSITGDVVVDGQAGWRMLSAPAAGWTVAGLAALNLVQGVPDFYPAAGANLLTGYDGAAFSTPSGGAAPLAPGQGFLWYLYDAAIDPGGPSVSVELPMTLPVPTTAPPAEVVIPLHRAGDGWNLVGNPYPFPLDPWYFWTWAEGGSLASAVGQVWDPNAGSTGGYRLATMLDGGVPPWTGMFLENEAGDEGATHLRIPVGGTPGGGPGQTVAARPTLAFELRGATAAGGVLLDPAAALVLSDGAAGGWDAYDALELASLGEAWVALAFEGTRGDSAVWKAQEARPADAVGPFEVPLGVRTSGAAGPLTLTWTRDTLPEGWALTLTDRVTGQAVDLRQTDRYTFAPAEGEQAVHGRDAGRSGRGAGARAAGGTDARGDARRGATSAPGTSEAPAARALTGMSAARFILRVVPTGVVATAPDGAPPAYALGGARPNPSRDVATLEVALPQTADVRVAVYDALGREVAVLADGERPAGRHALRVDVGRLAAGVYVVRMTAGAFVGIQRLTVVR